MGIPRDIIEKDKGLGEYNALLCYRGSISHNCYVPPTNPNSIDDKDVLAVCIPPIDYYYGLKEYGSRGTKEIAEIRDNVKWDIVIYEMRKYISLLEKGNPNVLFSLWLNPIHYIKRSKIFDLIYDSREIFLGKHIYKAIKGFAAGQRHRMTHYNFDGYLCGKRKALVDKYGFDCKNAMCLIRILRVGVEFFNDNVFNVERFDNNELIEIKMGEWGIQRVRDEADRLLKLLDEAYVRSDLPVGPNSDEINKLCTKVIAEGQKELYG